MRSAVVARVVVAVVALTAVVTSSSAALASAPMAEAGPGDDALRSIVAEVASAQITMTKARSLAS